jgi:hypothetical protein
MQDRCLFSSFPGLRSKPVYFLGLRSKPVYKSCGNFETSCDYKHAANVRKRRRINIILLHTKIHECNDLCQEGGPIGTSYTFWNLSNRNMGNIFLALHLAKYLQNKLVYSVLIFVHPCPGGTARASIAFFATSHPILPSPFIVRL